MLPMGSLDRWQTDRQGLIDLICICVVLHQFVYVPEMPLALGLRFHLALEL